MWVYDYNVDTQEQNPKNRQGADDTIQYIEFFDIETIFIVRYIVASLIQTA